MKSAGTVKLVCIAGALAVCAFVVFCAFQLPHLNTRYSVRQFFPKNHPILTVGHEFDRIYQLRASPSFYAVVELKKNQPGSWLEPKRLADLQKLTNKFAALGSVKETMSLGTVGMAVNRGDELLIGTLAETLPPKAWAGYVKAQPLLSPQLISADGRSALIVVEPKTSSSTGLQRLERQINEILKVHGAAYDSGLAGVPAVQSRLSDILQSEVGKFLLLSLLGFCLTFMVFYRNFVPVLFAGVGMLVCNVVVVGLLAWFGVAFTVLLSTLPIIVSIAFVSLTIHTLHLWADRLVEAGSPTDLPARWRLSVRTLREIALANFLGSLTTAIGFLALVMAPIPVIRDYAITIAVSVMGVFALTQFTMTFALPFFTPVQRDWTRRRAWWALRVLRWSAPIFVGVVAISVFLGGAGVGLNFSTKLFDDLPEKEAVSTAMSRIDDRFGGTVTLDVSVDAGHGNAWTDPEGLRRLREGLSEIRRLDGVGAALGLTDFLGEKIPATRGGVSEIYFLFSMAGANPLRHFVDNDLRRTRVSVRLRDLPGARVDRLRAEVRGILAAKLPKAELTEAGLAVSSHMINREVAHELVYGFWQSLVLIGVLLVVVFRSLRWALVACLPNLIPPAVLIGALAFLQTPVKPSISLIFSIALGLAFNNTVYLLTRLRNLRKDKGLMTLPLKRALLEEGNPCLSESLLMFVGFLIFLSSDFKLNQTFGAYMVLSIVAGALGDLVFLPAVLKLFPEILGRGPGRSKAAKPVLVNVAKNEPPGEGRGDDPTVPPAAAAAVAGLLFLGALSAPSSARADEAKDLLNKARQKIESRTDQAVVVLKIIEANGDVKERKMLLRTMREDGAYRALVRIQSPADIKGTALLAEVKDGKESQWLYLPSSRQVRRVVSAKTSGAGVLGSELNPDDLSAAALGGASAKVIKKTADKAWIEVRPKKGRSVYSRAVLTLSLPEALPLRLDYQAGKKVVKTVEFKDYVVQGGVSRARKIVVRNRANKRGTDVEFSELKVNAPLKASDFSVSALKKGI